MNRNKKILYIVLLIALVFAAGYLFLSLTGRSIGDISTTDHSVKSINDSEGDESNLSYKDAMAKYGSQRIVLDQSCVANPKKISVEAGGRIMVDNRAPMDRVIKLDSLMNIKSYGFKLINIPSTAGATLSLDCDESVGVATVSVQ